MSARRTTLLRTLALTALGLSAALPGVLPRASAEPRGGDGPRGPRPGAAGPAERQASPFEFRTDVPARDLDVVLGRPTRDGVTLSVRATRDLLGQVEWRRAQATAWQRTDPQPLPANTPVEIRLGGLAADMGYVARLLTRASASAEPVASEEVAFHTQRPGGATFTFTVQADSHLDRGTDPALYERTLRHVAQARPDFHVDLGDTFMTDKYRDDFRASLPQYVAQRWYLGLTRVPVFLALGNHDGEVGWRDQGTADDMPHWSNAQRKAHFPNPEPDGFYTGNATPDRLNGLLQNWYGWTWGDALFLVLDPFWATRDRKGRSDDPWSWTLGEEQYRWLERTLAASKARFRFVFLHHLLGGNGREARGGAEVARLYEWGGRSAEFDEQFAARRPGWSAPIHDLLRRAGPTVVFHGHDHFFAYQPLEGVVYQMVPQPGNPLGDAARMAAEYGYLAGEFLPSPGHVRVRVTPTSATVDLVRTSKAGPPEDGRIVFSYAVPAAPAAPR